jgi:plastocyanin
MRAMEAGSRRPVSSLASSCIGSDVSRHSVQLTCGLALTLVLTGVQAPVLTEPETLVLSESEGRVEGAAQRTAGAIRGRVDIRRAVTPPERRPAIAELTSPPVRELTDTRRAVVYLETAPAAALDAREPRRARIDQRNETFLPHVLAVDAGSLVDFPNNDSTYHNVFSLSKPKRFDLGRYARGKSKSVRFDRPGVVRVFCDIHSHMSAFVLVFSHPFYATTDEEGRYRIDNIPPGTYTVAAWHEGAARDTQTISIPPQGGPVDLDFVIE